MVILCPSFHENNSFVQIVPVPLLIFYILRCYRFNIRSNTSLALRDSFKIIWLYMFIEIS